MHQKCLNVVVFDTFIEIEAHKFNESDKWQASKMLQNSFKKQVEYHLSTFCCCCISFVKPFLLQYCHNPLSVACEHHLWTCKRTYYCQVVLYLLSLSLSFCLSCWSWQLMSFFLLCYIWDLLVLISAVTSAFCRISSGKTGQIWPRPELHLE